MTCPVGKDKCEGHCLAVKPGGQPFVCFGGFSWDVHPYMFWCLQAQEELGMEYWAKGRDAHRSHSIILDKIGHDRGYLDGVKKRLCESEAKKKLTGGSSCDIGKS